MFLLLFGLLLVVISLLAERQSHGGTACPTTTKYLPRDLDMMMKDAEDVTGLFKPMFEKHIDSSNNL